MSFGKDPAIAKLEQSLIQFLCQKPEVEQRVSGGYRRVRGLTIKFDVKNPQKPLMLIQIGMFEVSYNCITNAKERGHCYNLDRYMMDWFLRPNINYDIQGVIKQLLRKRLV